jgi:hypothetical protein
VKKGRETYLGWREITKRQEHVKGSKKNTQTTKRRRRESEKCRVAQGWNAI